MSRAASPREVFDRLLGGVTGRKWADLPNLYAEEAIVEHPFATTTAARLEGREQIREHFAAGAAMPLEMRADNVVIHETADPEVIIAEFDYHGLVTTTGRTFTMRNIFVLRVRDGLIVASRDYVNHLAIAAAFDRLPQLVAALTAQQPT
jgi:ketosteroid isomerase-like protein